MEHEHDELGYCSYCFCKKPFSELLDNTCENCQLSPDQAFYEEREANSRAEFYGA